MRYSNVKIEGGPTAHRVKVTDGKGDAIQGVSGAEIEVRPNEPIKVSLEIKFAELNLSGVPTFMLADPRTGKMKPVSKVEFADGSVFDVAAD